MKAWFLTGASQFEMREIDEPELKDGYVKVEVLTVQPSVTETVTVACEGDPFGIADMINAGKKIRLPAGHEMCGRVIETNEGSKFQVGDRVSTLAKILCGKCPSCLTGSLRGCEHEELLGITIDGVFSERALLPESGLIKVPDKLTDSEAANLQPLADCVAAVDSVTIRLGDTVAIFGAGCLGMNTMQVVRASGAGKIIVIDIKNENLTLAKELGATHTINGRETDPVAAIMEITGGVGADVIFEAAGGNPKKGLGGTVALNQAIKALKPEGQLLILAMYGESIEFMIGDMRTYGKDLVMPIFTSLKHLRHGASLIEAGFVKIEPLVNTKLEGIEQVPKAFEVTANKAEAKSIAPAQVIIKR